MEIGTLKLEDTMEDIDTSLLKSNFKIFSNNLNTK